MNLKFPTTIKKLEYSDSKAAVIVVVSVAAFTTALSLLFVLKRKRSER